MPFNRDAKPVAKALYAVFNCLKTHSNRKECNHRAVFNGFSNILSVYDLSIEEQRRLTWVVETILSAYKEDKNPELTDKDAMSVSVPHSSNHT